MSSSTQLACSCLGRAGTASILCPALKPFWVGRSAGLVYLQSKDLFSREDYGLAFCTILIHFMKFYGNVFSNCWRLSEGVSASVHKLKGQGDVPTWAQLGNPAYHQHVLVQVYN